MTSRARRSPPPSRLSRALDLVISRSLLLIAGAVAGLVWANADGASYHVFAGRLEFAVNDVGMVFFFAVATTEVVEAMLPGGPLSTLRLAGLPVLAAAGGMVMPAGLYLVAVAAFGDSSIHHGWAIPCATDIAFSYLAARAAFHRRHPAIPFLLLLAIADDAFGLVLLALFFHQAPISPLWLAAWLGPAVLLAWGMRRLRVRSFWPYVLGPGVLSWVAFDLGGVHPALAMVPIVALMPHGRRGEPPTIAQEHSGRSTIEAFERWWRGPVQIVLFFFGLVNAGVPLTGVAAVTWIVAGSLIVGKPAGIIAFTWLAERLGFHRAPALDGRALVVVGLAAGIGFTVALFFATSSFAPGATLDAAKLGALLSAAAAPLAIVAARLLGVRRESST